jgi:sugar (pentulose or hexulose) kinase
LEVFRPLNLWPEQDPENWWQAFQAAIKQLRTQAPDAFDSI